MFRIVEFLLSDPVGHVFPSPMIADSNLESEVAAHAFKLVDPSTATFTLLGDAYCFRPIQDELVRIFELAYWMSEHGCRLIVRD